MKERKGISAVTFHYMLITGGFWMGFCVLTAYAAVYLLGIGFNNTELGMILALGNVGGAVLSSVIGAWIDRKNLRHASVVNVLLALQAALLAALALHPAHDLVTAACYALYMTTVLPVNAVNLDLCVRLERAEAPLNFGLARSMGSFAFVILSTLLGILTKAADNGHLLIPYAGMAVVAFQFFGNRLADRDLREAEAAVPPENAVRKERSSSFPVFIRENKRFCLMLFGTVILFTAHNMDGNFLINEVRNLGGDEAIMGYIAAFTAIVEMPVMIFASFLMKKWETVKYIRLSFVFFFLKILAYALAPNIPLFFAARLLQAPSYALYTVLIVSYADSQVAGKDSAKAQSLAFSMTTAGSVLASLIGGSLFDTMDVRSTMLIAAAITLAGMFICLAGTIGTKKSPDAPAQGEKDAV